MHTLGSSSKHDVGVSGTGLRRAYQDRVISMGLDMLLQILWALKGLSAEITLVWLERDVDANVGGYVITLDGSGAAAAPLASQVQIVCALSADMALAHMLL
jgi:hypothetical protein